MKEKRIVTIKAFNDAVVFSVKFDKDDAEMIKEMMDNIEEQKENFKNLEWVFKDRTFKDYKALLKELDSTDSPKHTEDDAKYLTDSMDFETRTITVDAERIDPLEAIRMLSKGSTLCLGFKFVVKEKGKIKEYANLGDYLMQYLNDLDDKGFKAALLQEMFKGAKSLKRLLDLLK